jgi:hypothetical protein
MCSSVACWTYTRNDKALSYYCPGCLLENEDTHRMNSQSAPGPHSWPITTTPGAFFKSAHQFCSFISSELK